MHSLIITEIVPLKNNIRVVANYVFHKRSEAAEEALTQALDLGLLDNEDVSSYSDEDMQEYLDAIAGNFKLGHTLCISGLSNDGDRSIMQLQVVRAVRGSDKKKKPKFSPSSN